MSRRRRPARPRGLGAVTVIVLLVAMAALAAAVLRLGQQSQAASGQDVMGTSAAAAARSGIDWGLYQALKGSWTACSAAGSVQTLDLSADTPDMRVTVRCDMRSFTEGESAAGVARVVRLYTIDAVACTSSNAATACPDAAAATRGAYVERRRQVQAEN